MQGKDSKDLLTFLALLPFGALVWALIVFAAR